MVNTTQIKDGLILLLLAGVAIGGYFVARRVIDGVGSIGQGLSDTIDSAVQWTSDAANGVHAKEQRQIFNQQQAQRGETTPPATVYGSTGEENNPILWGA